MDWLTIFLAGVCVCVCVQSLSHFQLFVTLWIIATRLLCLWDSSGKSPGVSWHFLLQGIFPTQGSNPDLLHWQADSLPLHCLGNPVGGISLYQSMSSASGAQLKLQREQDIFYLTLCDFFSLLVLSGLCDKRELVSFLPFMPVFEGNFLLSSDTFTGLLCFSCHSDELASIWRTDRQEKYF